MLTNFHNLQVEDLVDPATVTNKKTRTAKGVGTLPHVKIVKQVEKVAQENMREHLKTFWNVENQTKCMKTYKNNIEMI